MIKKVARITLNLILSFAVGIFLTVFTASLIFSKTIFSSDYLKHQTVKSEYCEQVKSEIYKKLDSIGYASGLDESFFDEIIESRSIGNEINDYIDSVYNDKENPLDKNKLKEDFANAFFLYATAKGAQNDKELADIVNDTSALCVSVYTDSTSVPYISDLIPGTNRYYPYIKLSILLSGVILIVLLIVLFYINKYKFIRYAGVGTITAFWMLFLLPFILFFSRISAIICTGLKSFDVLFISYFNGILLIFIFSSLSVLLVSIILTGPLYKLIKRKYNI